MSWLAAKVRTLIGRAILKAVDDASAAQLLTLQERDDEEEFDGIEHAQPYGLSFRPTVGSEGILLAVDGDTANQVAVCVHDPSKRPAADVAEGEGGLYLDGVYRVFLAADGTVHLGAQEGSEAVAVASKVDAEIARIWNTLTTWTTAPNDGGAALKAKAALDAELQQDTGSATVKVEP